MAEFSFDIVSVINMMELDNALNQANKEILTRFDFKGSKCSINFDKEKNIITLVADDETRLKSLNGIVQDKLIKRGISLKVLSYGKVESSIGTTVKQAVTLQNGIQQEKAKSIAKIIKDSGLKVRTQIQGDAIRVFGKVKDDLQATMAMLKEKDAGIPLQFTNYR